MESARYGLDSARASYQSSEQQVILTILTAHLNVITAQKAYVIRSNNTKRLTAHTEAENIKLEAGTSTPTRLAEAEARLASANRMRYRQLPICGLLKRPINPLPA